MNIIEELKLLKEQVLNLKEAGEIENVLKYKTAYERFRTTALEVPDTIALMYFGNKITYRELLTTIDIAAKGYSELGVKENDIVTMSLLATPYSIVSFYALDKLGAGMHMINSLTSMEEIKKQLKKFKSEMYVANDIFCTEEMRNSLEEAGVKKIITTSLLDSIPAMFSLDKAKYAAIEKLKGLKKQEYKENMYTFDDLLEIGRKSELKVESCGFKKNHLAAVAYTSGSTGDSKACVATSEGIDSMVQIMGMTELGRFEQGDVMLSTFPLWIYYSLLNMIHEPLCLGVTLALDPLFNPKNIVKRNEQYKFNHWLTIPPYIKTMVEMNKPMDCSRWKIVLTGGDALLENVKIKGDEYIKRNGGKIEIGQGYGASECLGSFAYTYNENPTLGSVGIPCVGNMVKVVDPDTGKTLKANEVGVGYIYTPARMKEYYGNLEATNHNLVQDENGVTWYNTEDLIKYNERGEIFLQGRIRRIALTIDSQGNPTKIIPDKVKKEVSNMDIVDKCEVITVKDDVSVNKAILFVILKENVSKETAKEEINKYCLLNVPEYMVPKDIIFVKEIPLTTTKKSDFDKLEEMYNNKNFIEEDKKVKVLEKFKKHIKKS